MSTNTLLFNELNSFLEHNNLLLLSNYNENNINWNVKLHIRCLECNTEFSISIKQLLRPHPERTGLVCPKCDSYRKFLSKMEEKYNRIPYEFLSPFNGYDNEITVKCIDCGSEWTCTAKSLLMNSKLKDNNHPCKKCSMNRRVSKVDINSLKKELTKKFGNCNYEFPHPEQYTGMFSKNKMDIKCNICGHEMKTYISNILNPKNGKHYCRVCNNKDRLLEVMSYKERCLKTTNGTIEPLEEYIDSRTPIKHKCNVCGYGTKDEWLKIPVKNTIRNSGCPKCTNRISQSNAEKQILTYIKSIYKGTVEKTNRTALGNGQEIDIYVPDKKIGFELDGLYWHSEKYKGKKYHLEKTLCAHKQGIRLVHIFEDEWYQKQEICKDKIANILGVTQNKKIYARACKIENIKPEIKTAFLEKYHIQGKDSASIILGLKHDDELVAVMTFAKPRVSLGRKTGNANEYELSRFAASCNVVGGFSKLLKYAIKTYNIETINTYADIRWSSMDKNVYITNGFKEVRKCDPGYWYFDESLPSLDAKRIHRFNFRKQELEKKFPECYSKELTEFQIMDKAGYGRIWDCGNLVYILKTKN